LRRKAYSIRLLQLEEHGDVGRLEQAERDHRHAADDDVAGDDPAVVVIAAVDGAEEVAEMPAGGGPGGGPGADAGIGWAVVAIGAS
jgi:hypothetical protein